MNDTFNGTQGTIDFNGTQGTIEFIFNSSSSSNFENATIYPYATEESLLPLINDNRFLGYYTVSKLPFLICEESIQTDFDSDGLYLFWAALMASIFIVVGYELYLISKEEDMTESAEKFWKYLLYGYLCAGGGLLVVPLVLALVQCSGRKQNTLPVDFCNSFGELTCGENPSKCVWTSSRNLCFNIPFITPLSGIMSSLIPAIFYGLCQLPVFRNEPGEVDWLYLEKHKLENRKMISLPAIGVMEVTDAVDFACDGLLLLSFIPYPAFFLPSSVLFYMMFGLYNIKRQLIDTYYNHLYDGIYLTRWHHFLGPLPTLHQTAMDYIDANGLVLSHIPILGCVAAYDLRIHKKFMEPYLTTRFIWFSFMKTFQDLPQLILVIVWVTKYSSGPFVIPVIVIKTVQLLIWIVLILTQFREKRGLDREGNRDTLKLEMGEPSHLENEEPKPRKSGSRKPGGGNGDGRNTRGDGRRQKSVQNRNKDGRDKGSRKQSSHVTRNQNRRGSGRRNSKSSSGRRNSKSNHGGRKSKSGRGMHLYE